MWVIWLIRKGNGVHIQATSCSDGEGGHACLSSHSWAGHNDERWLMCIGGICGFHDWEEKVH